MTGRFHAYALIAASLAAVLSHGATAGFVPYTENFDTGSADWYDADGLAPVGWSSTGGPGGAGDAYATTLFDFAPTASGEFRSLFRAQDEFGSSGGAFEGDWITGGVTEFRFMVRHTASEPIDFFARFTGPANFPGAASIGSVTVNAGIWTEITIDISPTNPQIIYEGGPSNFFSVFGDIGHVQVGVVVPDGLAGGGSFTFDLDAVSAVPAPASGLVLLAGLFAVRRRRDR